MNILCEVSVKHVHLSVADVEALFGKGAKLEFDRALSQPGQFLAKQRVVLVGPKRKIENVAIIGPERAVSQVELARTDCFALGIYDAPVRESGDIQGTPGIKVMAGENSVTLEKGVIVAKRHIHLDPQTAKEHGFADREIACVKFEGERGGVLGQVIVRVHENFAPAIHLDTDEGNAVFAGKIAEVTKTTL